MEFRDALKSFRSELGLAQTDIAQGLHINIATVGRWEAGRNTPNRSLAVALFQYAKSRAPSSACLANLEATLDIALQNRLLQNKSNLFAVEHSSVSQLIENASFPVYVCDFDTNDILYANQKTVDMVGLPLNELKKTKCYQSIMHSDSPCESCHKHQLLEDVFTSHDAYRSFDNTFYRVQGKLVQWNGHKAQVHFVMEMGGHVNFSTLEDRKAKYQEQLQLRRQYSHDAIAVAHYNLTQGTVEQVECRDPEVRKLAVTGEYEHVMAALRHNSFCPEDQKVMDAISDRKELIKLFYQGKTHIRIRHCINGLPGYYEGVLDLFQNPTTFDVEAFAKLCNITDATVADRILDTVLRDGYESICTIHADTGEAHPYKGNHINEVISVQNEPGNNVAGIEAYLRAHCTDPDVERIIKETSLPCVKEQLRTRQVWDVAYSLKDGDQIKHKLTSFSYLDAAHTMILCVMQDVSEAYRRIKAKMEAFQ